MTSPFVDPAAWTPWQVRCTFSLVFLLENDHLPRQALDKRTEEENSKRWCVTQTHTNDVGDGQLTYAGVGGQPIASIRLHAIRDGVEDFGYLDLLRKKRGDAAVQVRKRVFLRKVYVK
jgi:hypothetical protein